MNDNSEGSQRSADGEFAMPDFLHGGGEMGAMLRSFDWNASPLGPPQRWPQGLRTAMRLMLNTGHPVYIFWGQDGLCFYNDAYRPSLGPERHPQSMGQPAREVWAEIWPLIGAQLEQVMSGGGATWDENRLIPMTRNGQVDDVYWTYSYSPIDDETAPNGIGGVLTLCTETTAQVEMTRDLASSEQRLSDLNADLERQIVERSRERGLVWQLSLDLLSVIDMTSASFDTVNPAWTTALGWRTDEIEGHPYADFVHPDDIGSSGKAFEQVRAGHPAMLFENRYRAKDGSWRWLSWVAVPEAGKLYSVTRDVTDEKAREAELEAARDQLRQAQKMEAVGQLTGGIAHDFNNMLTGITGSLELLKRYLAEGRQDRIDRYIDAATTSAQRAAGLTQRLLAFSRRQSLDVRPTDVNRLVVGMEDLLRRTLGEGVGLEISLHADTWPARTDANQLESALLNLTINARDAMPDGGRLTIETTNTRIDARYAAIVTGELTPGDYVVVSVSDTGTGMTQAVMAKVFDPFFTTKPLGQGTGLGLSMIYGFAQQSGGHVRVYSELGQGTTFKLFLPRDRSAVEDDAGAPLPVRRATAGECVMLVEDDPSVRMLVVDTLEELGYSVVQAADGRQALPLIQKAEGFDLLITDVGLPGLNGRQVAEIAREKFPGLKVLFITGYAEKATVRGEFLDEGMEMITKPFAIDTLASRVREMIED